MQTAVSNEKLICLISIDNILAVIMKQIEIETGPAPQINENKQREALRSCFSPYFVAMMIAELLSSYGVGDSSCVNCFGIVMNILVDICIASSTVIVIYHIEL